MEITLQELIAAFGGASGPAGAAPFADHLIGKRVLVRTRISGVSAGTLASAQATPAGYHVTLNDAVRIWRWEGGALACSELATKGPDQATTEAHPDGIVIADEGLELHPVTDEAWARISA